MGRKVKSVDEGIFFESIAKIIGEGYTLDKAAEYCGLSTPTYSLRVNQYFAPERFGEVPEGFFK